MPLNSSVSENGEITITSGDRLTVESAADFSRILNESLQASDQVNVVFDAELVMDITAVQAICSACKSAAKSGKTLYYTGDLPAALTDLIASSGAERRGNCKHNNDSTCIWFGGAS